MHPCTPHEAKVADRAPYTQCCIQLDLQHVPERVERVVLVDLRGPDHTHIQPWNEHLVPETQSESGRRFDRDLLPPLTNPVHLQTTPSEILAWQDLMPELFQPDRHLVELTTLIHQADAEPFALSTMAIPKQHASAYVEGIDGVEQNVIASSIMIRQYVRSKKQDDKVAKDKVDGATDTDTPKADDADNADQPAEVPQVSFTHLRVLNRLDLEHSKDVSSSTGQSWLVEKKWFDYAVLHGVGIVPKDVLQWVYEEAGEGMYWSKGGKGLTLPNEAWRVLEDWAGHMTEGAA
jgi:hypothetical protein